VIPDQGTHEALEKVGDDESREKGEEHPPEKGEEKIPQNQQADEDDHLGVVQMFSEPGEDLFHRPCPMERRKRRSCPKKSTLPAGSLRDCPDRVNPFIFRAAGPGIGVQDSCVSVSMRSCRV